jgi:hypothetical protein
MESGALRLGNGSVSVLKKTMMTALNMEADNMIIEQTMVL